MELCRFRTINQVFHLEDDFPRLSEKFSNFQRFRRGHVFMGIGIWKVVWLFLGCVNTHKIYDITLSLRMSRTTINSSFFSSFFHFSENIDFR